MIETGKIQWLLSRACRVGIRRPLSPGTGSFPLLDLLRTVGVRTDPPIEDDLVAALKAEPDLRKFDGAVFRAGSSETFVDLSSLARWLLVRTAEKSSAQAVHDLRRYLALGHNPGFEVLAVSGIAVEQSVQLCNGISLIPFSALPESTATLLHSPRAFIGSPHPPPAPGAALVKRCVVSPQVRLAESTDFDHDFAVQKSLSEACLWLTLVGPSNPLPVASWWQLDSWVPFTGQIGSGWGGSRFDVFHGRSRRLSPEDAQEAQRIHALASSTSPDTLERLRVPLERLNQALRRHNPADRAIDLGIALESVLLTDREHSELSFQFRLRGAWLIGKTPEQREKIMKMLGQVYECRSRSVHAGKLPTKIKGRRAVDILDDGAALTVDIIKVVAKHGIPDWGALVAGSKKAVVSWQT